VISETNMMVVLAVLVLLSPLPFLGAVVTAILVRLRTGNIGRRLAATVAFTAGLCLGALLLFATESSTTIPIVGVPLVLAFVLWRGRRRAQAGWLLAGMALPWTLLLGFYLLVLLAGIQPFDPGHTVGSFLLGVVPLVIGVAIGLRGDPPPLAPAIDNPPGQPGSRSFGSIASAIRQPTLIGPAGQPEILLLVALVALSLVVPFLIPAWIPALAREVLISLVVAVIGTEVYVRGFPTRSRQAFEAFSWLGEWELAGLRAATGKSAPTSATAAERWLADRPERSEEAGYRVEVLLLARRTADARDLVARLPASTPWQHFERAALHDLVEWMAGGEGDLPGLEAAAAAIPASDVESRLRAEVSAAVANVRRRMASGMPATEAIQPLIDVRPQLGARADGQIGRALRRRMIPLLFLVILAFSLLAELTGFSGFTG
jgi:hypothetical protein